MDSEAFANIVKKKAPLNLPKMEKDVTTPIKHLQDVLTSVKNSLQELHDTQASSTTAIQSALQEIGKGLETSQSKLLTDVKADTEEIKKYLKEIPTEMEKMNQTIQQCQQSQKQLQETISKESSKESPSPESDISTESIEAKPATKATEEDLPISSDPTKGTTLKSTDTTVSNGVMKRIESIERKLVLLANQLQANQEYIVAERAAKEQQNVQRGGCPLDIDTTEMLENTDDSENFDFLFQNTESKSAKKKYKLSK